MTEIMTIDDSRFTVLFDNLPIPACLINSDGQIVAWNAPMQTITGRLAQNVVGQPLRKAGQLAEALYIYWATVADKRVAVHQNIQSDDVTFQVSYLPTDTDWLIMLTESDQERRDSLYLVAHDLQNPLTGIKGFAELIGNIGEVNERQKLYIKRIMTAVDEMAEMLGNLLDVAWVDSGMKPKIQPANIAHLVHAIANNYKEQAKANGVDLKIEIDHIPNVLCDERRMKQVINNLISNAIKYSPNGGTVTVSLKENGNYVFFEITDEGLGIAPEYQSKIFDRFYRVPRDIDIEGNGLGLAISYEILQKHGEELFVQSAEGAGSRFYFKLPTTH